MPVALLGSTLLLTLGCARTRLQSAAPATPAAAATRACALAPAPDHMPESLTVATTSPVDPTHAPVPTSAAERFAFAQSYETLIDADCEGHPRPGLAQSWTTGHTGTQVTLVLREGARFWNGDPVRAADVVSAWRAAGQAASEASRLASRMAEAATVIDDRTLIIALPDSNVALLALPALAVARQTTASVWAEGTGPYRAVTPAAGGMTGPIEMAPVVSGAGPRLLIGVRTAAGRGVSSDVDLRDALDAGADLIPDAGPEAASYAAARAEFAVVALPWDRTYLLAAPDTASLAARSAALPDLDASATVRLSLARDAVRADARVPEAPFWWQGMSTCSLHGAAGQAVAASSSRPSSARIAYPAGDQAARDLAERVVALGRGLTATGLDRTTFARALRTGSEGAYVVAVPHRSLVPCRDLAALYSSAPWLDGAASSLVPLVDTRRRAILRRGRVAATVDWDGTLRLVGAPGQP